MKKLSAFIFMLTLLFAAAVSASAATKQVRVTTNANVRSGPGLKYKVRGSVSKGKTMGYKGSTKRDKRGVNWFKVSYRGGPAWISSRCAVLSSTKKVKATGNVYLRKGPGLGYSAYTSVPKGTKMAYRGKTKTDKRGVSWFNVTYKGKSLWISSRYAEFA